MDNYFRRDFSEYDGTGENPCGPRGFEIAGNRECLVRQRYQPDDHQQLQQAGDHKSGRDEVFECR